MGGIASPLQGTIARIDVAAGDVVRAGQQVAVIESMKMEHVVSADVSGVVREVAVAVGDTVLPGQALLVVEEAEVALASAEDDAVPDVEHVRADLAEVVERHALGLDAARPAAVERRRSSG